MHLHQFARNFAGRPVKSGTKLTHPSTNIRLHRTVSKICLHDFAIKLTVHIARQNTQTLAGFKAKPARRSPAKPRPVYRWVYMPGIYTQRSKSRAASHKPKIPTLDLSTLIAVSLEDGRLGDRVLNAQRGKPRPCGKGACSRWSAKRSQNGHPRTTEVPVCPPLEQSPITGIPAQAIPGADPDGGACF